MNRQKELIKNSIIIAIGRICTQFITIFLLPIYTKYLSTEDYGIADLLLTYVSLLAPLISLQIEFGIFRFLIDSRTDEKKINSYISSASYLLLLLIAISIAILLPIGIVFKMKYLPYLIIIVGITMISNLLLQVTRGLGDTVAFSIASFIAGSTNALINIVLILFFHFGIEAVFIASIISNILCSTYLIRKLKCYKRISKKYIKLDYIKELLKYSIPLVPNSINWWIMNVSDKSIISLFLGTSANGIYSISTKLSSIIVSVYNIFNMSWTESISIHINDKDASDYLSSVFNSIIKFVSSLCCGLTAFLPIIFEILIGEHYNESAQYIPILLIGTFFNIIMGMLSAIYIAKKKSKEMTKTTLIAAILNLLINLLFVKKVGLWAAALSTALSYFIVVIYRMIDIKKYLELKIELKTVLLIIFMFTITNILYIFNQYLWINIVNMVFTIIISFILNMDFLKNNYKKINKKLRKTITARKTTLQNVE